MKAVKSGSEVRAVWRAATASRRDSTTDHNTGAITIRDALADDALGLGRLAALDSRPVPAQPLLVAEVDGDLRAALSMVDGAMIADPFHRTAPLVELLAARAVQRF